VELRDYLMVLRHRWMLVAACVLLAIGAGAGLTLIATPQYASTVRLFVSTPQSDTMEAYQGGLFSAQRAASYADLVTGPEIAQRVVDRLGYQRSAGTLASQVSATVVPKTVILRVTVTDPDPYTARRLATAVGQEFTRFVDELESGPASAGPPIKASLLGPAVTQATPVSPQPLRNVGLAAVLGLLLGVGLAVLRETLDSTIRSAENLATLTATPLLGSITNDPRGAKRGILNLDPYAPHVEAYRVLRTNLQFVNVDQPSRIFVVTSSVPEEGKTTTACNLALTLAQAGHRVALVDGDLRRPSVADALRLEPAVGLTTVLIGRITLAEALQPAGDDGLAVLASGVVPPAPAELLQSRAMADLLAELRRTFDIVLIDAPPLLPVTDAALLAAQAEGALLVVRYGKSTRDQVRASVERLSSVRARLVGTLFNRAPHKGATGMSYGYGYAPAPVRGRSNGKLADATSSRLVGTGASRGDDDKWRGAE
jgi:capsular exopolysaccharide synthesis family protein